ncbi:MAG: hypothetical protein ACYCYP_05560 [Leptospirales bacterium]
MDKMELALNDIRLSMDQFMSVLDGEIESARRANLPEDKIKSRLVAFIAIKDSGQIYLDWAEHYIRASFKEVQGDEETE